MIEPKNLKHFSFLPDMHPLCYGVERLERLYEKAKKEDPSFWVDLYEPTQITNDTNEVTCPECLAKCKHWGLVVPSN